MRRLLGVVSCLLAGSLLLSGTATAAPSVKRVCRTTTVSALNLAAPVGAPGLATLVESRSLVRELGAIGTLCSAKRPPAWARKKARRAAANAAIVRRFKAGFRQRQAQHSRRSRLRPMTGACNLAPSGAVEVDFAITGVLSWGALAQALGNEAAGMAAVRTARALYEEQFATIPGTTVGDAIVVARGAQALGLDGLDTRALREARTRLDAAAAAIADRVVDTCAADAGDLDCAGRIEVLQSMIPGGVTPTAFPLSEAAEARAAGRLPADCQQWAVTMRMTSPADGRGMLEDFVVSFERSEFIANTRLGTIRPLAAGVAQVGSVAGRCVEEVDGVLIDHGAAQLVGTSGSYQAGGSATATSLALTLTASGTSLQTVYDGGETVCEVLGHVGTGLISDMLNAPIGPFDVQLSPGQTSWSANDSGIDITLDRVA